MTQETDALSALHRQLTDAAKGYGEGLKLTTTPAIAAIFTDLRDLHTVHAREIAEHLRRGRDATVEDGSFMTVVHKAVMNARAAVNRLDESAVPGIRDGEERILRSYRATMDNIGPDCALRPVLDRQRATLTHRLDRLELFAEAS